MLFGLIVGLSIGASGVLCWSTDAFAGVAWLWMLPLGWLGSFLGIIVLAFLLVLAMCSVVDLEKEEIKDNRFYRTVLYLVADAAHTVLQVRVHAKGLEKVPTEGRVMLVCNHLDNVDPVIIMHQVKKMQTLAFIAKRETATMFVVGKFMHKLLCQRINRENDREALKTILKCIQIIKEDKASIAVFPEGYIYPDRKLHRFRHGVFKVATKTNVPIAVCTLRGTTDVLPSLKRLKPSTVEIHLVDVIYPEDYAPMTTVELGDRIYDLMAADLGAELVSEE